MQQDTRVERVKFPVWLQNILGEFEEDEVRVFGSFAYDHSDQKEEWYRDVDVVASKKAFPKLLYLSAGTRIHPMQDPEDDIPTFHKRASFKECRVAIKPSGEIEREGRVFEEGCQLSFNELSVGTFSSLTNVFLALGKLNRKFDCRMPYNEQLRIQAILGKDLSFVGEFLQNLVPETILEAIFQRNATIAGGVFRDFVLGKSPKDIDVFCVSRKTYEDLCNELSQMKGVKEHIFKVPEGARVNLRKFLVSNDGGDDVSLDVIEYGFVQQPAHVVETFDFSFNMLWMDPLTQEVSGSKKYTAFELIEHICQRKLVVGTHLWYRAGLGRALQRWERFRKEGFVPSEEDLAKYQQYVELFKKTTKK